MTRKHKAKKYTNRKRRLLFRRAVPQGPSAATRHLTAGAVMLLGGFLFFLVVVFVYIEKDSFDIVLFDESAAIDEDLAQDVRAFVAGSPMEAMVPYVAQHDRVTAALLVGIAKKESDWGRRTPKRNGQECYNYWGYRGKSLSMTWDGYTCFHSPRHAVRVVGGRIAELVHDYGRSTPQEMIVWKCGRTCAGHSAESVRKWISDVDYYFQKLSSAEG